MLSSDVRHAACIIRRLGMKFPSSKLLDYPTLPACVWPDIIFQAREREKSHLVVKRAPLAPERLPMSQRRKGSELDATVMRPTFCGGFV